MQPIIEACHLSKEYHLGHQKAQLENLRDLLAGVFKRSGKRKVEEHFWALRDVNFTVESGEVIGIIGRNGAGKSTLLKVLSRITDPTEGLIHLRGRLASLLEVGTGFHPELTGRENIFLNGAILGMRRAEINAKFDEIVAFSEIEKFLDTPVKHYSSGMYVRLAFAVAAHLNPEILVVDEVLAVGDMAFQKKCLGKMGEVSRGGRTVLFVSHNMAAVENLCRRGMVLKAGQIAFDGSAKDAIQYYLNDSGFRGEAGHVIELSSAPERRSPQGSFLQRVELFGGDSGPLYGAVTAIGDALRLKVHFDLPSATDSFNVGIRFFNSFGQVVLSVNSNFEPHRTHGLCVGRQVFVCDIPSFTLLPGEYTALVYLDIGNTLADRIDEAFRITVLHADYYGTGRVPETGTFVLKQHWYLEPAAKPALVAQ